MCLWLLAQIAALGSDTAIAVDAGATQITPVQTARGQSSTVLVGHERPAVGCSRALVMGMGSAFADQLFVVSRASSWRQRCHASATTARGMAGAPRLDTANATTSGKA